MLVGHNPCWTELVNQFCAVNLYNLPTCAIAKIEFDVEQWQFLEFAIGNLVGVDAPKQPYPMAIDNLNLRTA